MTTAPLFLASRSFGHESDGWPCKVLQSRLLNQSCGRGGFPAEALWNIIHYLQKAIVWSKRGTQQRPTGSISWAALDYPMPLPHYQFSTPAPYEIGVSFAKAFEVSSRAFVLHHVLSPVTNPLLSSTASIQTKKFNCAGPTISWHHMTNAKAVRGVWKLETRFFSYRRAIQNQTNAVRRMTS